MRYLFLIASIIFTLVPTLQVQAASNATFKVNTFTEQRVYGSDFNVVAMDVEISTTVGDILNTLTVTPSGTARPGIEVAKMRLWQDIGDTGFQGWGYDKQLAEATLSNIWVFKNISHTFASSTERFFITVESNAFITDKTFQIKLSQPLDAGDDGVYQANDTGVFFDSGSALDIPATNSTTIFFKESKIDQRGGIAFVNSLEYGQDNLIIDPITPIKITGEARDRGLSVTNEVIVNIDNKQYTAVNTGTNFSTWEAIIEETDQLINGPLYLTTKDGDNNTWVGPEYNVLFDLRKPSLDKSFLETQIENTELTSTVTLASIEGELLPSRELLVNLKEGEDLAATQAGATNDFGEFSFTAILKPNTTYILEVVYKGAILISSTINSGTETTPPPTQNPDPVPPTSSFQAGDLIKGSLDAVYYYSKEGKRHVFVTQAIYNTWYNGDFSQVKTITDAELAAIPLGRNVGFRPGSMLTSPSINEVYFVDRGQVLKHIGSEQIALSLFGSTWNKQINDLQDSLLFNYNFGAKITSTSDVNLSDIQSTTITIDDELALS